MKLIIGGAYQGKKEYTKAKYHIQEAQIWQGGYPVPAGEWRGIYGLHNIIKQMMNVKSCDTAQQEILVYIKQILAHRQDMVLICDEVGSGIVPVDQRERAYRECVGRVLCELAKEADTVERVHCGIGQRIKYSVYISLIRHGSTKGNLEKRYIGVTDEPLCEAGTKELLKRAAQGQYPPADHVVSSPMKRCLETVQILYPGTVPEIVADFRETDFGPFEGKTYEELMADEALSPLYQAWIEAGKGAPVPEGKGFMEKCRAKMPETAEQMRARCGAAFERLLPELGGKNHTALILHGGAIMSIMSAFAEPGGDYYDYLCENGAGFLCRLELTGDGELYRLQRLPNPVYGRDNDSRGQ